MYSPRDCPYDYVNGDAFSTSRILKPRIGPNGDDRTNSICAARWALACQFGVFSLRDCPYVYVNGDAHLTSRIFSSRVGPSGDDRKNCICAS